ncbi:hypothetical protein Ddc_21925 [Ditylenchus destructor]|nr:hypothetical protein Ddc_21925 [Ditylenchus destructor]
MPSGLLEASRSICRQPDLVFLEAQTVGYPTTPRSPQTEREKSICRQPDLVFMEARDEGYPPTPRSPQTERSAKSCAPIQLNPLRAGFPGSPDRGLSNDTKIAHTEREKLCPNPAKCPQGF